ncbi:hypothetical protein Ae201684P_021131 [Aphanomyces euteiches]|nr:hypothetical protein Ae201684P_021131 [Aphanomyces euteiches]
MMFGYTGYDRGSDHWCNTAATYLNARPTNPNCTTIPTPVPTPAPTPAGTKRAVCFEIYAHQDWYLPLLIDANGDVAALSVAPTRLSECEPKQWSSDPIYVSCGCGFLQMFGYTGYDRGSDHWCNTAATYLNARPDQPELYYHPNASTDPCTYPGGTKRAVCFEIYAHQDWYLPLLIDANGDVAALSVAPTRLSECEPKQWSSDPIYVSCGCGFLQMFGYTGYDRGSDHWCNTAATYLNARPTNPNCTTIPTPIYAHQDWYLPLLIDANGDVAALSVAPTRLSECEPKQWSSDPIYVSCGCGFLQMFGYTGYDRGSDHWCNTAATYLNARPTNPNCTTIPTPIYAHQDWYLPLLIDANGDVAALSVAPTRLSECEPKQWSSDPIYVSCGCGFLQMFGYTGYDRGSDHWCNTAATYLNARPTNPNCTTIPTPVPTPAPTPAGTKRAVCFEIYAHQDWYLPLLIDANGDVAALSVAPTRLSECEPKQWSSDPIYVSCGCGFLQMFGYTGYDRGSDHWCNTAATYLNARPTNPNCTTIPTPVPTPAPTPAGTKRAVCFEIYAHQDWYLPLLIDANGDVAALSVAPTRLSECEPKQWSSDPIYVSCGCGFLQMFGYTGYDRGSDHWCNTAATTDPAPTPAGTKRAVCFEIYAHQDWYLPLLIDANGDVAALSVAPTRLSECEPKQWSSDPIYVSCGCGFLQMFGYTGYDRGSDHWCNTAATYLNARPTNPNCTTIPTPVPTPAPTRRGPNERCASRSMHTKIGTCHY